MKEYVIHAELEGYIEKDYTVIAHSEERAFDIAYTWAHRELRIESNIYLVSEEDTDDEVGD